MNGFLVSNIDNLGILKFLASGNYWLREYPFIIFLFLLFPSWLNAAATKSGSPCRLLSNTDPRTISYFSTRLEPMVLVLLIKRITFLLGVQVKHWYEIHFLLEHFVLLAQGMIIRFTNILIQIILFIYLYKTDFLASSRCGRKRWRLSSSLFYQFSTDRMGLIGTLIYDSDLWALLLMLSYHTQIRHLILFWVPWPVTLGITGLKTDLIILVASWRSSTIIYIGCIYVFLIWSVGLRKGRPP